VGTEAGAPVTVEEEAGVPEQVDPKDKTEEIPGRVNRPQRSAAVWAWAHLEKYHKLYASRRDLIDIDTVPTSIIFRRECPAAN